MLLQKVHSKGVDFFISKEDVEILEEIVITELGKEYLLKNETYSMGVDDFAYYTDLAKGVMFNLGTRNEKTNQVASLHNSKFNPDENAFVNGVIMYLGIIKKYCK